MYEFETTIAHQMADASGQLILKYFRKPVKVEDKKDSSPVTVVDRSAEELMRDMIAKVFPNHGIIGEEYGREKEHAEFVWVIDPIDGTKSFITGSPLFGTLISLLHEGKPVLGIINQPYTKERWVGISGQKTIFKGRSIKTRPCLDLSMAALYSSAGRLMFSDPSDKQRFEALCDKVLVTRFSTDCYGYGLLAMGCGDIVCEANMKIYDYAALTPIVQGAGGFMSDWDGAPLTEKTCSGHVLALGDQRLLPAVMKALKK